MKILSLLFSILFLSFNITLAQNSWVEQSSNTSEELQSIQFIDTYSGWTAGGNEILYTTDRGDTWSSKSSATFISGIKDLSFVGPNFGLFTGSNGIIKTDDAGSTWQHVEDGSLGANNSIFFPDSGDGWAVGDAGVIIYSSNGGNDWNSQTSGVSENLNSVYFKSSTQGWAVGNNSTILYTTNGGTDWTTQSSGTVTGDFYDVKFVNSAIGFISGSNGIVLKTIDAGINWTKLATGTGDDLYFVFFYDENSGWAGGQFGTIIYTDDGGTNWQMEASGLTVPLHDIYFVNNRIGWSVGKFGKIIYTQTAGQPLRANFDADTTIGFVPLTVHFTDKSTGFPSTHSWDFGDGEFSTEANPVHTYARSDTFSVALTITSGTYSNTKFKEKYITVNEELTANFDATPTAGSATLTVDFTDMSLGYPDSWLWDFGDGSSSTFQNPNHSYEVPGKYEVSLTVTKGEDSDKEVKTNFIEVYDVMQADFYGSPLSGAAPLAVNFHDNSLGHPTIWSWDFGDGGSSSEAEPTHIYNSSGTYTVGLTVSDGIHEDSKSVFSYIRVSDALNAEFSASPLSGDLPLNVSFTDHSTGGANHWTWNFGDGGVDTVQNPVHTFLLPGKYTVKLTVSDGSDNDSETKPDYITVTGTPILIANFYADSMEGMQPFTVHFMDSTVGGVSARSWDFGDGNSSEETNPTHIYSDSGHYSVTLIVSNGITNDTAFKENYIHVIAKPSDELNADFEATPRIGDIPLNVIFTDKSTGHIASRHWDFGDSTDGTTVKDPIHTYRSSGSFTVKLTLTDDKGNEDIEAKANYIIINGSIGVDENTVVSGLNFIGNFPNPFVKSTKISYELNSNSYVKLTVCDVLGNPVKELINDEQIKGNYNIIWYPKYETGESLPAGIYYYTLLIKSNKQSYAITKMMVLVR